MKNYSWIFLAGGLLALAFAPGACGGGGGGGTTTGTGGSTTTSSSSHSSSGVTTSSGTGGGSCSGIVQEDACGLCLEGSCCKELNDCFGDQDCNDCLSGNATDPTVCSSNTFISALKSCTDASCKDPCTPKSTCNPVTNEGCTNEGAACDLSTNNVFVCFDGPGNDTAICMTCSNMNGPFCAPGSHCNDSGDMPQCTHYCCTDADCGTGTCDKTGLPSGVGICLGGVAGDAGADAGAAPASCDAPAAPPSGGSCYTP